MSLLAVLGREMKKTEVSDLLGIGMGFSFFVFGINVAAGYNAKMGAESTYGRRYMGTPQKYIAANAHKNNAAHGAGGH